MTNISAESQTIEKVHQTEATLTSSIVEEYARSLVASDFSQFSSAWVPMYYRGDHTIGTYVTVEALGFSQAALLNESLSLWSVGFSDEGQRTNLIMFGGHLYSFDVFASFKAEYQRAPDLLALWERIQASEEEPVINVHGGGNKAPWIKPERIPVVARNLGKATLNRLVHWLDETAPWD